MSVWGYPINFYVGIFLILLGLFSLVARILSWDQVFWKLEPMRKIYGRTLGNIIHLTAYTLLPVVAGTILLLSSLCVASIWQPACSAFTLF